MKFAGITQQPPVSVTANYLVDDWNFSGRLAGRGNLDTHNIKMKQM
jgi:hypothetical protein